MLSYYMLISEKKKVIFHFAAIIIWILAGGVFLSTASIVLSPSLTTLFVTIVFKF